MTKLSLILLVLSTCNRLSAMEQPVTLPSTQELNRRLEMIGLRDFNKKTKFDIILGGQKKYPCELTAMIDMTFKYYQSEGRYIGSKYRNKEDVVQYMAASKSAALRVILQ